MLAQFHREIVVPDIERIVGASERRLGDEMYALHDASLARFERLETEYAAIKAGLGRVEQRLDSLAAEHRDLVAEVRRLDERLSRVEKRLDELVTTSQQRYALQAEVQSLRARLDVVEAQVAALQKPRS
jgi:predicted  nucleic acid-binding Zn-ribbon protein